MKVDPTLLSKSIVHYRFNPRLENGKITDTKPNILHPIVPNMTQFPKKQKIIDQTNSIKNEISSLTVHTKDKDSTLLVFYSVLPKKKDAETKKTDCEPIKKYEVTKEKTSRNNPLIYRKNSIFMDMEKVDCLHRHSCNFNNQRFSQSLSNFNHKKNDVNFKTKVYESVKLVPHFFDQNNQVYKIKKDSYEVQKFKNNCKGKYKDRINDKERYLNFVENKLYLSRYNFYNNNISNLRGYKENVRRLYSPKKLLSFPYL